jgi:hypothetical protein
MSVVCFKEEEEAAYVTLLSLNFKEEAAAFRSFVCLVPWALAMLLEPACSGKC